MSKYNGRTYEELKSVKIADMTGEENEFFNNKGKEKSDTPSIVNNFFYGIKGMAESGVEMVTEKAKTVKTNFLSTAEKSRTKTEQEAELHKQIEELTKALREAQKK